MVVDDFYTTQEQELVWQELESYKDLFKRDNQPGDAGVAVDKNGNPLANLKRIYLEELYPENRQDSNILSVYGKVISKEVVENYKNITASARQFERTNRDQTVVSYYENSNNYAEHFDSFMHTVLIWFYKEPKRFEGGNLTFPESTETVECIHNRMIIFPSYYLHEVDKVKIKKKYRNKGLGRYCITHFYYKV
tara:strand:- start:198 stop:776 length:579 start_codon:yes stop_codon:yes gene_type:complete